MKPFSDFNKQIKILENRNLTILDRKAANFALRNYGYYEIVNGYKIFLLDSSKKVETFLEKENLEELGLSQLKYEFDEKFRALEEAVKPLRKSEHTHKIKELDNKRDIYLMGFISHCKVFINFELPNSYTIHVFSLYEEQGENT